MSLEIENRSQLTASTRVSDMYSPHLFRERRVAVKLKRGYHPQSHLVFCRPFEPKK